MKPRSFYLLLLLAAGIILTGVDAYLNGWSVLLWAAGGAVVGFAISLRHRWLWRMRWYRRWYKKHLLKGQPPEFLSMVGDDPDLKKGR